jgi:hypothetical protein
MERDSMNTSFNYSHNNTCTPEESDYTSYISAECGNKRTEPVRLKINYAELERKQLFSRLNKGE